MELISTQFNEHLGELTEESHLKSCIPNAQIVLSECPPIPSQVIDALKEMGLYDGGSGQAADSYFEATLEMPPGLSFTLVRPGRQKMVSDLERIEELLLAGYQYPGPLEADPGFYPGEDGLAELSATLEIEGAGEVLLVTSGENFQEALRAMQLIAPETCLNS